MDFKYDFGTKYTNVNKQKVNWWSDVSAAMIKVR